MAVALNASMYGAAAGGPVTPEVAPPPVLLRRPLERGPVPVRDDENLSLVKETDTAHGFTHNRAAFGKQLTCPAAETLLAHSRGALPALKRDVVQAHLTSCDFCGAEFQLLSSHPCADAAPTLPAQLPLTLLLLARQLLPVRQMRILCVDDDEDTRNLLEHLLGYADMAAVAVPDTAAALGLIAREQFSLYIIDSQLPGVSGLGLCEQIRRRDQQTPVIIFSGHAYPADRAAGLRAGANAYLVKPDTGALVPTVRRLLAEAGTAYA